MFRWAASKVRSIFHETTSLLLFTVYQCKTGVIELQKANVSLVSSNLLSDRIKIKICRTDILYGCETEGGTTAEDVGELENRVLRVLENWRIGC